MNMEVPVNSTAEYVTLTPVVATGNVTETVDYYEVVPVQVVDISNAGVSLDLDQTESTPTLLYKCSQCDQVFSDQNTLTCHEESHYIQSHSPVKNPEFRCQYCNQEFSGASSLAIHLRSHTKEQGNKYKCDHCNKSFPSLAYKKKHLRIHTGETPYECSHEGCNAKFKFKETFNRHLKTHNKVKPHECAICNKSFIQPIQWRQHMFHHTGEYGFQCTICEKSFSKNSRLKQHMSFVHSGEKEHQCDICEKRFVRKEDMKRHMISHSDVRKYKCDVCGKSFGLNQTLKAHMFIHTKSEPQKCQVCGKIFPRKDSLLRHIRARHKGFLQANHTQIETIISDTIEKVEADEELEADDPDEDAEGKTIQNELAMNTSVILRKEMSDSQKERNLRSNLKELLGLLIEEGRLKSLGYPKASVVTIMKNLIAKCGFEPVKMKSSLESLRGNARLLFTSVIDDASVKQLLKEKTLDDAVKHFLELAKSD